MQYVYGFDHEHPRPPMELKDLLGGKGANLAEMVSVLDLPVPPGFTISTEACRHYLDAGGWPPELEGEVDAAVARLEELAGRQLGDPSDPLLVSVRSGAKFSMPGMMDTVLDLGLNDESVRGLAEVTGDARFAYDSYRRFIQMFGEVVLEVPDELFDARIEVAQATAGDEADARMSAEVLAQLAEDLKAVVAEHTGQPFPQDPRDQLRQSIDAVFRSWNSPRARAYRNREHIDHHLGTAVNVQMMVFGNRDERSGTGVGFTRDPATGDAGLYGDFLLQAQGEDVVAGTHATRPLAEMADVFPEIHDELVDIFGRLERHYRDMLDTEFTIEQGKLWMLQTRVGKRTGTAALRLAVAMTEDPNIRLTRAEAVQRVTADHLDQILHPQFEKVDESRILATGLGASPGAAVGQVYFTADDAVAAHQRGEKVLLVRPETSPDDIHGMQVAEGVLTSRGGLVSHAAVVARGWGKPAVVGAEAIHVAGDHFTVGDRRVEEGEVVAIDGQTGDVILGEVGLAAATTPPELDMILEWADEIRADRMSVRANADNGPDATVAREYGAEGIGLCRTEHMFLGEERLPVVQRMILASTPEEEQAALDELLEVQREDFVTILEAMDGLPVTVRLLDPPLHEFLPDYEALLRSQARDGLTEEETTLFEAASEWREVNPMLGTRGVRLGIVKGGLYKMQVRALLEAAALRADAGGRPIVEIMIPLVVTRAELALVRRWVEEEIEAAQATTDRPLQVGVGTMIETPRAAIRADDIAEVADFFSFGTNDLTQMAFGFSRDDVEARVMPRYLDEGILPRDPFESIDVRGVGELVALAVERGRKVRPDITLGVCGEHGGDPASIDFFTEIGLDYVSCSPFRVPVARLAVAQALLAHRSGTD
ncbi:pyruvate, phosphate dikinase [Actinomarinicola tropica]|uniref:Pyruvate, phosphate dikinase n=2 Tax=Actinomarinicola tropica TaxID=2789776 RepID=A0A5Q2RMH7_9ACTN|nr:pyruvate, phosphate dikinase [Actinomarinicola tropica]QGG95626.1 pyruvate, phosphate dikinase [Actinomarinicola tropica]